MKYWRGYLTAAIFAAITWALTQLAAKYTTIVDMVFPYMTRMVMDFMAQWSGQTDIVLWQLFAVVAAVVLLATIVLMVVLHWNPIQWAGWVLAAASGFYLVHMMVFGLNYYAGPLAEDVRLEVVGYTVTELADATRYYRDQANVLADQIPRDGNGAVKYSDFDTLAAQAEAGFRALTYDRGYPVFAGNTQPVKKLGWSGMYTSMGITGVTMGVTGEAAVNPEIPPVSLPFTMCHEMAHRMSITTERDANFAGFLACDANPSLEYRYSGYFMAFRYCYNALAAVNTTLAQDAVREISAGMNDNLRHDSTEYNQFFASRKNETATKVADTANDTYLKASGDSNGIASYGEVCDLLVCWHLQEVAALSQEEEKVPLFDPFDETQVDLSGLGNYVEHPAATEPAEEVSGDEIPDGEGSDSEDDSWWEEP